MKRPAESDNFGDEENSNPDSEESADDEVNSQIESDEAQDSEESSRQAREGGRHEDPLFIYLLALALSIGLVSLPGGQPDLRFTLLWSGLAGYGVLTWVFTDMERVARELPEDLAWGLAYALILAGPLLVFGGGTLSAISLRLFGDLRSGAVLALLVFVMPLSETLFFRGAMQERYSFWLTGLMASVWSALLYLPQLEFTRYPAIALIVTLALLMMSLLYGYVRQRNGLAAAWLCQIGVNLILLFLPFVASQGG